MADAQAQAQAQAAIAEAVAQAIMQAQQNVPAGAFSLSPAANNDIIDYSKSAGGKIYSAATKELTTKFSIDAPNIPVMLDEIATRAMAHGWGNILNVNIAADGAAAQTVNILERRGQVTMGHVTRQSLTYVGTQARTAQNNHQLYVCLSSSLDEESRKKMVNDEAKYLISPPGRDAAKCGVAYLKLLLTKAEVDTRATADSIRSKFVTLDKYMQETAKDDITKFNEYVRKNLRALTSRNEQTLDLLTNLFRAYRSCGDRDFQDYIKKLKREHDDSITTLDEETLTAKAELVYNTSIEEGTWKEPTFEQEEIIALRAEMKAAKAVNNDGTSTQSRTTNSSTQVHQSQQRRQHRGKPKWMKAKLKDGEAKTKTVDGKEYHYCKVHHWGSHTDQECSKQQETGNAQPVADDDVLEQQE